MIIIFSEIFESFWTLSDNCAELWLKLSAAFPNVHSTCPKYFFGFFCERISWFFKLRTQAKKTLVLKKKFRHFCCNCILSVPRTFWWVFIKNVLVFQFSLVFQANWLNSRRNFFSSRQKCILSQNFSNFGETFEQNRQKSILRVQRNTLTKTLLASWNNFRLWAKRFRIRGGKFAALLSNLQFDSRGANRRIVLKEILHFLIFFRTSREHFLVFSLYRSKHGGPKWIPLAKRNISARKNFVRKFSVLSGLGAQFFKNSLKYFTNGCQNYNLRVQRSTLTKVFCFWDICKRVLRLWAIIVHTSGEKFQQRCPNCILRVKKNFAIFFCSSLSCFI